MRRFFAEAMRALLLLACAMTTVPVAGAVFAAGRLEPSAELVDKLVNEQDHRLAVEAAQRALDTAPDGTSVAWNNPDNGHAGSIAPTHTYEALGGGYCREYDLTVTVDGRPEHGKGAACRQSDGNWRPFKNR